MSLLRDATKQRTLRVRPTQAVEQHIAKALGHYLRVQILWILNERIASPSELAEELGVTLNRVSNHIKVLREAGCVELVERVVVGNTVQRFYRATARIFLDDTEWPAIPATVQEGLRITLLQNLMDDAIEAVAHEMYDALEGSHMSWTPMIVDDRGREELIEILERALKEVLVVQENAGQRLCSTDDAGTSYSVSILGYPSIGGMKKVNPAKSAEELPGPTTRKAATKKVKATRKNRTASAAAKPKRKTPGKAAPGKRQKNKGK